MSKPDRVEAPAGTTMPEIAELEFIEGPQAGQSVRLSRPCTTIGRSKASDVVLEDAFASRTHAKILADEGGFVLVNLSRNGTRVNKKRVKERRLRDGDVISMGAATKIRYVVRASPSAVISHVSSEDEPLAGGLLGEDEPAQVPTVIHTRRSLLRRPKVLIGLGLYLAGIAALAVWLSFRSGGGVPSRPQTLTRSQIAELLDQRLDRPFDVQRARQELARARDLAVVAVSDATKLYPALAAYQRARAYSQRELAPEDRRQYEQLRQLLADKIYEYYLQGRQRTETKRYRDAQRQFRIVLRLLPDEKHPINANVRKHIRYVDRLRRRR